VASSRGPAGLDAHSLIEASAVRGPFVYAVAPTRQAVPVADVGPAPADLSPAGVRNVGRLAQRRLPAARRIEA
jgi:hypothetical protein